MRTRKLWGVTLASLAILAAAVGPGMAQERSLVGIVLGRSYRTVLDRYGTPDLMVPVTLPTASALLASSGFGLGVAGPGVGDPGGFPGASPYGPPGMGGPGGFPGSSPYGPPGAGGPGGFPGASPYGPPGMGGPGGFPGSSPYGPPGGAPGYGGPMGPGGPPVLPPAGGEQPGGVGYGAPPGAGGYGGFGGEAGAAGGQQGNAVKWVYARPGGGSLEFWINEDGRVAQIAATGRTGTARTSKGIRLGSTYSQVLKAYGAPETHRTSAVSPEVAAVMGLDQSANRARARSRDQLASYAQLYGGSVASVHLVNDVIYTSKHRAAFTFLGDRCVRITIALAD